MFKLILPQDSHRHLFQILCCSPFLRPKLQCLAPVLDTLYRASLSLESKHTAATIAAACK
jgi:hypothetical protein